jgi:redox-regulated HSP33 family molecular chaperone
MKTVKYFISFENLENQMCNEFEISKAEYNKQIKFLREQIKNTEDTEAPIEEMEERVLQNETLVKTIISFNCGCSFTDLIKMECKAGYCFTPKK